jgi:hypothetical protein
MHTRTAWTTDARPTLSKQESCSKTSLGARPSVPACEDLRESFTWVREIVVARPTWEEPPAVAFEIKMADQDWLREKREPGRDAVSPARHCGHSSGS